MQNTTLCYIEKDGACLMLHRVKKVNDVNKDKWIGVGGHILENESPDECVLRETFEETGLTLTDFRLRGIITFVSDEYEGEYMYLYTASGFAGELRDCDEGTLEWVTKDHVPELPIWEGDKLFLKELARDRGFFTMKLVYHGETLSAHSFRLH